MLQAGGYLGIWTAGVAWYIAFAELLNEVWFRGRVSSATIQCSCQLQAAPDDVSSTGPTRNMRQLLARTLTCPAPSAPFLQVQVQVQQAKLLSKYSNFAMNQTALVLCNFDI